MTFALSPDWLVEMFRTKSRKAFVPTYGGAKLLLVQLAEGSLELVQGLEANSEKSLEIAASQAVTNTKTSISQTHERRRRPDDAFGVEQLAAILSEGSYFVTPLQKRRGVDNPFPHKVCVGRSLRNDIVLSHPSVSKYHAWLDVDDEGVAYLKDLGSKNTTTVNGDGVGKDEFADLYPGDQVAFGHVRCLYCTAETLYDALAASE